jgi:hypothetical protein
MVASIIAKGISSIVSIAKRNAAFFKKLTTEASQRKKQLEEYTQAYNLMNKLFIKNIKGLQIGKLKRDLK